MNYTQQKYNAWLAHYKIYKIKVLLVVLGIVKDVCKLLVVDNVVGNIRAMIKEGAHTSSWVEEYIVSKDISNG